MNEVVSPVETDSDKIYNFNVGQVLVYFYINSNQHFDFDPKEILSLNQWNMFLDFFTILSKKLKTEILFMPEDGNYENIKSILVQISGNDVVYNFDIKTKYIDN